MTCYALVGAESADRYADALLRLPEACVAAVVDADGGRRGPAARRLGAGLQAATVAELLAAHPDCCSGVLVHGAADARLDDAAAAARHGKHVLLELPPAAGADGLAALGDECAAAGVCLMIGGTLRFLPSQQVLKQRLDSGKLGELGLLRAHRWHAAAGTGTGAAPAWQALAAPYLDLANWLFDDRPERVWARTAGPGYAQIHLGFRAGGMALIDVSAGLPPGDGYQSVSVIGSGRRRLRGRSSQPCPAVRRRRSGRAQSGRGQPRSGRRAGRVHRRKRGAARCAGDGVRCRRRPAGGGGCRRLGGERHRAGAPGGSL